MRKKLVMQFPWWKAYNTQVSAAILNKFIVNQNIIEELTITYTNQKNINQKFIHQR